MKSFSKSTILGLTFGVLLAGYAVFAFDPPTAVPPGGNVLAPINVGALGQEKSGGLILNTGGASNGLIVDKGNVGIGTTTPSSKLDIVGGIRWSGSLEGGSVPWGRLTSVPSGLNDGDQVGITSESDPQVGAVTSGQWCRGDGGAVQCDQAVPSGLKLQGYAIGSSISTGNCSGSNSKCRADAVTLQTTIATTGQYLIIAGINLFQTGTTTNTLMHLNIDGSNIGAMSYVHGSSDIAKSTTVVRTLSAGLRTLTINYSCTSSNGCTITDTSITVLGPL